MSNIDENEAEQLFRVIRLKTASAIRSDLIESEMECETSKTHPPITTHYTRYEIDDRYPRKTNLYNYLPRTGT